MPGAWSWERVSGEQRSPPARVRQRRGEWKPCFPLWPTSFESVGNLPVPHAPPRSWAGGWPLSVLRVLVFAAHPDDEVLGMGGTIALHTSRGDEVRIVCVTDGSSTQYPGDADTRARKKEEARGAATELGVLDYVHLDLPDMRLDTVPHVEVNKVVEEHVRDFLPRQVYTPQPDVNLDHRALFDSVVVATRPTPEQHVRRLLTYAPTSSTEWTPASLNWFVPNWFVDVTATLERKLAAFAHYETERRPYPHPRSERAIRAAAELYGASSGCEYAEPFVLVRSLEPG